MKLTLTILTICMLTAGAFAQGNKKEDFTYYEADKFICERYENGKPTGDEEVLGIKVTITRDNVFNKLTLMFLNSDRKLEMENYDLKKAKEGEYIYPSVTSGPGRYHFSTDYTALDEYNLLIQKGNTFFVLYIKGSQIKARFKFTNVKVSKKK